MPSIYTDQYRRVIDELKRARKAAGVTQQRLAEALSQPQSFVSKVENGERRLDIVEFAHFCQAIAVDPCELLAKSELTAKRARNRRTGRDKANGR